MSRFTVTEGAGSSGMGPHSDHPNNLKCARNFIGRMAQKITGGINVQIKDSEKVKDCLMVFSYTPPLNSTQGRHAYPVNLHDSFYEVRGKVGRAWAHMRELQKEDVKKGLELLPCHNQRV